MFDNFKKYEERNMSGFGRSKPLSEKVDHFIYLRWCRTLVDIYVDNSKLKVKVNYKQSTFTYTLNVLIQYMH